MTVLVTGGAGFVGTAVVRRSLEEGEERPFVFDIEPSTRLLDDVSDRIEAIRGDLGNFSHVLHAVQKSKPRAIYHLGGMLSLNSDADPAGAMRANALGTFHVLEAARLFQVPQVLFSSSMATYALDIQDEAIGDQTLQRPLLFYGATKVFGEHMGLFYRRKYGLDFRSLRYPAVVGPGVKSTGIAQYNSRVIEECAKGQPYTIYVAPHTRHSVLYIKDAARAMLELGRAPIDRIKTVNYVISGIRPAPTSEQVAESVRKRIPAAQIDFAPDPSVQAAMDRLERPMDDRNAQQEWGWTIAYDLDAMVDDFLADLENYPNRYA
jgi:nucleoside-diphosphate-sugar epimerase